MRLLLLLILSLVLISCKNEEKSARKIDYTGFKEQNLVLTGLYDNKEGIDTLGNISMKLPPRLDTFYRWQHESDCKTCGETKYRFADNRFEQYAENGFFWTVVLDSVYQLNIWHKPYRETPDSIILPPIISDDSSLYFNRLPELVTTLGDVDFFKREFRVIENRNFIITGFLAHTGYLTQKPSLYLIGLTNLQTRPLYIIAECSARDTTGFTANFYKSLLSVRIFEK